MVEHFTREGDSMQVTIEQMIQWIINIDEKMHEHKKCLTSLDRPIGDGDHGLNMARGFHATAELVAQGSFATIADLLKACATSLVANVGGAAGPLYATAFLRMSLDLKGKTSVTDREMIRALEEALKGIKKRGQTELGEKTMIDVWQPVVRYLKEEQSLQVDFMSVAEEALESTRHIEASKGRASYFKGDSIGYLDPGAASSYLIFQAMSEVWSGGKTDEWSRNCISFPQ